MDIGKKLCERRRELGLSQTELAEALKAHAHRPVYLTIDLDVFDPSLFPGTGTPEYGGIDWPEFMRVLDVLSCVLTVAGAIAFLALCWLLIRSREAADAERRARDPQGAAARVERRLMDEDAAYRLCRRASASVICLPKEAAR